MSEHVLSILVKAVGAGKAAKDLKGVDAAIANIGTTARRGIGTAIGNIAKLGLVAGAGLGAAVKSGIDDLAALENATTSVDGAIRQMGQTGQITAGQVAGWANDIEADIGAAFDDKDITSATATLIRFGSVTPKNLRKAMTVMTDLAAKTGDVDSAATLLAKALADPEKAAGKLARTGIVLTKVQQDNIKALVKAGETEKAQAVLLDIITTKTKGAAEATQGPYKRALSVLADVSEDAKKALAEGFLPVLERVAGFLSKKLADPKVIEDIRGLGRGLADAFSKALDAAEKIPWGSIGDAMKLAGQGAKAALDLFTGLPPWVQTAVLTGWGLNKLTGGAVGGIVGELGKGLIKGVLGINAGVVNVNGAVVNAPGGVPGVTPGVPGPPSPTPITNAPPTNFVGQIVQGLKMALPAAAFTTQVGPVVTEEFGPARAQLLAELTGATDASGAAITAAIKGQSAAAKADAQSNARVASDAAGRQVSALSALLGSTKTLDAHTLSGLSGVTAQVNASKAASVSATQAVASAVRAQDLSVAISVPVSVTTYTTFKETSAKQTTFKKYQKTLL